MGNPLLRSLKVKKLTHDIEGIAKTKIIWKGLHFNVKRDAILAALPW